MDDRSLPPSPGADTVSGLPVPFYSSGCGFHGLGLWVGCLLLLEVINGFFPSLSHFRGGIAHQAITGVLSTALTKVQNELVDLDYYYFPIYSLLSKDFFRNF